MSHRLVTNRYIVMSPSQDGWLASHQIPTAYLCTLCVTCPTSCQEVSWATSGDETTSRWESVTYIQLTDELCARRQERRKKTRSAESTTSCESRLSFLSFSPETTAHQQKKKNYRNCLGRTSGDVNGSCSQLLGTFFFLRTWKIKAKTNLLAKRNREPERSGV